MSEKRKRIICFRRHKNYWAHAGCKTVSVRRRQDSNLREPVEGLRRLATFRNGPLCDSSRLAFLAISYWRFCYVVL